MRSFNFIILLFVLSPAFAVSDQYPYYAFVAVTETSVRSGPGMEFYPTSQLWLGDKVEVYYETENWCAIRPPIGSFSWISARYVDLGTNSIGYVIADGLASRIGSDNTKLCDTVQVKLKKGEKVLVLDRIETPENIASPLWFKIVPPSGEFRWIPRDTIMLHSLPQTSKQNLPKRKIVQVAYDDAETDIKNSNIAQSEPIVPPPTRPVKMPTSRQIGSLNPPNHQNSTFANSIADLSPLSAHATSSQLNQLQTINSNSNTNFAKEPDPFQKAFEELKEETRIVLTRPTEDWVFDTLIHRGAELYEIAPTDTDLEKVYHLVETLQRTKTVRQEISMRRQFRNGYPPTPPMSAIPYSVNGSSGSVSGYTLNSGAPAPMNPTRLQLQSVPQTQSTSKIATVVKTSASVPLSADKTTEFDLVGKLGEFQPLPKGHPPFALVDEKEQIICLVSPAADVDLKSYSGKTVGINGILGIFEKPGQPNRRHILAREIEHINLK
ncbi:MAG: hypothetical protein LBI18_05530 [Planctomycetaceae bacterium]|jgi:hypothetical protein|nr:hypothetical protein [Planctomycetaceae bacterium]